MKETKITPVIYYNCDMYVHQPDAEIKGNVMKVGIWKRRQLNSFIWGIPNTELLEEAREINRLQKELNERNKKFIAKLHESEKNI